MTQTADIQPSSLTEILEKLRHQAQSLPPSPTASRYHRALASLEASVLQAPQPPEGGASESVATPPSGGWRAYLSDWLVGLWLLSTPFSTASLYLDIISALYGSAVKAGQLPPTEIFTLIKTDLKTLGPDGWKKGIDEEIFTRALRLTKNAAHLVADDAIAADLVILSLTGGLTPLDRLALLKREDLVGTHGSCVRRQSFTSDEVLSLIITNIPRGNGRRRYLFPLRQSERTPKQLSAHISRIVNALFKRARLPQATDAFQTVEALWAYAALRTGIPASAIVGYLGHAPLGLPVLKLCISSVFSPQSSESAQDAGNNPPIPREAPILRSRYCEADTFRSIGSVFLDNPPSWYAMSLRPGVRFTQVCRRIQLLSKPNTAQRAHTEPSAPILRAPLADTPFSSLQLFYPCEEIARAIGKKIVIKQRPFIHSVVFFKAKLTDIGPLFACIGDLAWCYKETARPGALYAHISQQQFELFQRTIARFTPDYEVASTGELQLKKNDRVEIVGGLFAGHEATFDSIAHGTEVSNLRAQSGRTSDSEVSGLKPENTVYRLNIIGDNGIEWRISLDPRIVKSGS